MQAVSSISRIASLMADPKRSAMLWALIDGTPRPTAELAMMAGLSCSSACAHLSLLSSAGLLSLESRGRKRYFRLATPEVAAAVEALATLVMEAGAARRGAAPAPLQIPLAMRRARRCGDHLGGELAAELFQRLIDAGWLARRGEQLLVNGQGRLELERLGVYIDALAPHAHRAGVICRCSQWSDQGPHLGGVLGQALFKLFLQSQWVLDQEGGRALQATPLGIQQIGAIARVSTLQVG
ncbi:helix-turn-helix transcriptional regulator [Pseudomonas cremoricolorata]|uniref:helix-turn-helix transcriptional regulator n=1 Tax=Pseudomonas cremoricolorata TaxID=157783 RepID=UPI000409E91E|nr:helix-turn-helix transcriptional regulator [Pseudomonas cremoricolorata]